MRAVDHMSWSAAVAKGVKRTRKEVKSRSINGLSTIPERVTHDHLDDLADGMRLFRDLCGELPHLWKADIDAAFRRVPITQRHISAAGVAWVADGVTWMALHLAMPFGAASSVWAWHRIGALLCTVARRILHLPVYRYVDDYFSMDRCAFM